MAKERFFNLPVLILIASSFMLGMSEFIMVGILPDIAVGLKVSEVTVGNLVSLFAFVYAPVTPLGSALSARFPRFATHMTLIGVFLAGNLLCAFAPNYAVLMAGRILIALVSGTLVAIAMTYAPDVATDTFRTKFIAWVFSGFSIASVVGCAGRHLGGQRVRLALGVPSGQRAYRRAHHRHGRRAAAQQPCGKNRLPVLVSPVLRPLHPAGRARRGVRRGRKLRVLHVPDSDHAR